MITDADITKLKKEFATKEDLLRTKFELEDRIGKIEENMATKDDFRRVMTVLDKVLKEVLAMRQEQTMHVENHRRINDRLDAIEKVPAVVQHLG